MNLATEEYLLKSCEDDFLFLYSNQPCVVVGKHQIAQKEINSAYVFEHNILVARRLSGGGSVYHDSGNLNFSFIRTIGPGENISYQSITSIIVQFLRHSGLEVEMSDRNDILSGGKKISGSAMHIYKNRVLAHGTLLINSNLVDLSLSLKGNPGRYKDKSIASKRAKVMNISEIDKQWNTPTLLCSLTDYIKKETGSSEFNYSNIFSNEFILDLAQKKYSSMDWIYGYSPKYTYQNTIKIGSAVVSFLMEVEKGIIISVKQDPGIEIPKSIHLIFNLLRGEKHNIHSILSLPDEGLSSQVKKNILKALF